MNPWFRDLPLDFSRDETRRAEKILVRAYPTNSAVELLAKNVGLDTANLHLNAPPRFLVHEVMEKARAANRFLRLLAELLADDSLEGFREGLLPLLAGFEAEFASAIFQYRPSLDLLASAPPNITFKSPGSPSLPLYRTGILEQLINPTLGFVDLPAFRKGLVEAEIRTARILDRGRPKGTGFLVGEQLLLTNWHVVAEGEMLSAQFDLTIRDDGDVAYSGRVVSFSDRWRVASSKYSAISEELSDDGPAEQVWDYALVRLSEPVGGQPIGSDSATGAVRGWYKLQSEAYPVQSAEALLVVGHPSGRPAQLSFAAPSGAMRTKHDTRFRYLTNTEPGSSGSPVFNKEWRVVALHHASGPNTTPGEFVLSDSQFNQGVPIHRIVADLKEQLSSQPTVLSELALSI